MILAVLNLETGSNAAINPNSCHTAYGGETRAHPKHEDHPGCSHSEPLSQALSAALHVTTSQGTADDDISDTTWFLKF